MNMNENTKVNVEIEEKKFSVIFELNWNDPREEKKKRTTENGTMKGILEQ